MLRLLTSRATMFALLAVVVWAAVLVAPARGADGEHGYLLATSGGDVVAFGDFDSRSFELQSSAVSMAATSDGTGVVLVEPDGTLHAQGSVAVRDMVDTAAWDAGEQASAIVATPANDGFWVVTTAGRVHQLGDAPALGDVSSLDLSSPITAASATLDGGGLYLIGADGGIFALGTAEFWGSVPQVLPGVVLDAPVVGLAPSPSGLGYWLVASDGGLFSFGDAAFQGSIPQVLPGVTLNAQVVGAVPYGDGYLMVGADGGVFNFSNLSFLGSLGADPPADPVVSVVPVSRNGGDIATSSTSSTPTSTSTTTSTSTSSTSTSSTTSTSTTSTTSTSTTSTTSTSTTSTSTTSTSTTSTSTTSTSTTSTCTTTTSTTAPAGGNATITVWHDTTPDFAYLGVPQRWGNVMGKVTDPQG
ncbi:MAG: hypothetical protein GY925_27020, partial [Actinomycetia bacterium]|nr:hypothetical protein [Actinomycetes bacterium]